MLILHVNDRLSARGGADLHLLSVVDLLQQEGCEVLLAVGETDGTAKAPCPVRIAEGLTDRESGPTDLEALWQEVRPDVVHLHNTMNPEVIRWAQGRNGLMTIHDHRLFCPGRGKVTAADTHCTTRWSPATCTGCFDNVDYRDRLLQITGARLAAARRLPAVVLSQYMRQELVAAGFDSTAIHRLPAFVHGLPQEAPSGPPCVIFCGRLVTAKGVDEAVEAWQKSGTELPLVFAGTGSSRNRLEAAGFEVLGWLDRRGVAAALARARALLFPPRWQEPYGIVGLEAASLGIPVVSWRSGGIEEWHPGGELLVPYGDIGALSRALVTAVDLPPIPFVPPITPQQRTHQLISLYQSIASS
jgi:glycosyltransferase involved in cell wall biosynthesis